MLLIPEHCSIRTSQQVFAGACCISQKMYVCPFYAENTVQSSVPEGLVNFITSHLKQLTGWQVVCLSALLCVIFDCA